MGTIGLSLLVLSFALPDADALPTAQPLSLRAPLMPDTDPAVGPAGPLIDPAAIESQSRPSPLLPDSAFQSSETHLRVASKTDTHGRPEDDVPAVTDSVRAGDSLSTIFKRHGLPASDVHAIVSSRPHGQQLRDLSPGQGLRFELDGAGQLRRFEYTPDAFSRFTFSRESQGFQGAHVSREADRVRAFQQGTIQNSLFLAGQKAGLSDAMTMKLAQIFQWDIDFVLDIRRGDEFAVLFEELYIDGEFVGYGDILAAEFVNQAKAYKAIRYTNDAGETHYYAPNGEPMRQAFLRAPVEFSRISSNFNLNRRHPLFNRSMPHRGIDYAAPVGTPVLSAGDGRVVTASRTAPNGNYLVVQHGTQITTKYLHLVRFARDIKQGTRVRQGQIIGYVGATGWATGPHLHYEFVVNGRHQDPRTVALPRGEPISKSELARFKAITGPLLAQLADHRENRQLALAR
ncbi:MAG: peptidoglycan DD-metalloendopeptidase family protein [Gammaproteobacteria bacterium]